MEFMRSSLSFEVSNITRSSFENTQYQYRVEVRAAGEITNVTLIKSIDVLHDYENNSAEVIMLVVLMGMGTYHYDIYKNRRDLEVTIIRTVVNNIKEETDRPVVKRRFKAILKEDSGDLSIQMPMNTNMDKETMDRVNLMHVTFQLIDASYYELAMRLVGGTWRGVTNEDVIKILLSEESKKVSVPGDEATIGVNVMAVNNTKKMDHVIIPHGKVGLVDVVEYLQSKGSGIYSTGAGLFYLARMWYVYSLYDTTRYSNEKEVIDIINVPASTLAGIEKTYVYSGGCLKILATGDIRFNDDSEQKDLNYGNGSRITNADKFIEGFSTTTNNRTVIRRPDNNSEFVDEARLDGRNYAPASSKRITANPFVQYSELSARAVANVMLTWENGQLDYLRPGLPVKLMYLDEDTVIELKGVLIKAHAFTKPARQGVQDSVYTTTIGLMVAVDRKNALNHVAN